MLSLMSQPLATYQGVIRVVASGLRVWKFLDSVSRLGREGPVHEMGSSSRTGIGSVLPGTE